MDPNYTKAQAERWAAMSPAAQEAWLTREENGGNEGWMVPERTPRIKKWPKNDKPADFTELVKPFVAATKKAFRLERRDPKRGIPYGGYDIGKDCAVNCLRAKDMLSASGLAYNDKQGRDPLTVLFTLAVQIGIEQGRRITFDSPVMRTQALDKIMAEYLRD